MNKPGGLNCRRLQFLARALEVTNGLIIEQGLNNETFDRDHGITIGAPLLSKA